MPDHLGKDQRKTIDDADKDKPIRCKCDILNGVVFYFCETTQPTC